MSENLKYDASKMLVSLERQHRDILEKYLYSVGLFSSQHRILMYLSDRENNLPSQKEIAETFNISPAAVAVSLRKLENAGYIKKNVLDKDNRVNNISLTEKGKEVTEKTLTEVKKISESLFSALTDEELRLFCDYMLKLQNAINDINK